MNDPVVAEIRKAREEYARKFNYDFEAMCDDLQRRQKLSGARLVSLPGRPPISTALGVRDATGQSPAQGQ